MFIALKSDNVTVVYFKIRISRVSYFFIFRFRITSKITIYVIIIRDEANSITLKLFRNYEVVSRVENILGKNLVY
jgi:hypothetical protein